MGNLSRGLHNTDKMLTTAVSPPISTKHHREVVINQEKKGFLSKAKRFPSQFFMSENPGPGSYNCASSSEVISPSFSVKGTTGFIVSKASRPSSYQQAIPGPNAYNLQSSLIDKYDFNTGVSRVFRLPVAVKVEGPKHKTPAPNQYDVRIRNRESFSSVVGTSAFLSKTERDTFNPNKDTPSPCHYEVNTSVIRCCPKAVSSPFRSKSKRIPAPLEKCAPGPGAYSPHQIPAPVKRTLLPRGPYVSLAHPPLVVPKDPPVPGPGHYDIMKNMGSSKHPVPTAAFASRTERTFPNLNAKTTPGPGFYDPLILSKQSFMYTDSNIWIPF
ncbi:O(6)-methylguanine-induced apoptosis 2 isoform X2 [Cheilinus undulatus]|uniref:O(6)-methylguanine-induced apoptosis 2 isoform X2 n=1 Tax=Cheilinus undulatus TaxID=241271 RepID=UPI001BD3D85D|nr:O(6)-methylguanine-induced apoptosis 2 isoform X2 [Cheilinus undulatus]